MYGSGYKLTYSFSIFFRDAFNMKEFHALLLSEFGIPSDYSKPIEIVIEDPKISPTPTRWLMECSGHIQFVPEPASENAPTLEPYGDQNQSV